jgi:hypothetical protein
LGIINIAHRKAFCKKKLEEKPNAPDKESRKGSGGSSGKTLKRNLYPLNCGGLLPRITMERV